MKIMRNIKHYLKHATLTDKLLLLSAGVWIVFWFTFATIDTYHLKQLKQARQKYLVQQIRDQVVDTLHYQTPSYTDIVVKSKTKSHLTLGTKFGKKTMHVNLTDWMKKDPILATYVNHISFADWAQQHTEKNGITAHFAEKRYQTALSKLIDQKSNQIIKELLPKTEMDEFAIIRYQRMLSIEEKLAAFKQNKGWTLFAPQKLNFKHWKKINLICYYNSKTDGNFLNEFLNQLPSLPTYYYHVDFVDTANLPTYKIDTKKLPTIPLVRMQVDTKNVADVRNLNELDTALQEYVGQDLKAYWRKTRTTAAIQPDPQSSTQSIKRDQTTKQIRNTVSYEKAKPNHHYTIISTLYIHVEENDQQKSYVLNDETHPFNPAMSTGEIMIEHPYDKVWLDKWQKEHPNVKLPENIPYAMTYKLRE